MVKIKNIFWNLVFIFDCGGILALCFCVIEQWPQLVNKLNDLLSLAACITPVVLAVSFFMVHGRKHTHNGYYSHGVHYGDD